MMRERASGLLLLLPVTFAIVFSWTRLALEPGDVPRDDDYAAAAKFLDDKHLTSRDAIVVQPAWSLRPLRFLGDNAARVTTSDGPWQPLVLPRHDRVFVLVEPDAPGAIPAGTETHFGNLRIVEVAGASAASFDARASLAQATIEGKQSRKWALCTENGADTIAAAAPSSATFPSVMLQKQLVVAAGHTRDGSAGDDVVTLTVLIDGEQVASLVRAPGFVVEPWRKGARATFVTTERAGQGYRVERIDTARFADGRPHTVQFLVSADGEVKQSHFCYDAFVPSVNVEVSSR